MKRSSLGVHAAGCDSAAAAAGSAGGAHHAVDAYARASTLSRAAIFITAPMTAEPDASGLNPEAALRSLAVACRHRVAGFLPAGELRLAVGADVAAVSPPVDGDAAAVSPPVDEDAAAAGRADSGSSKNSNAPAAHTRGGCGSSCSSSYRRQT